MRLTIRGTGPISGTLVDYSNDLPKLPGMTVRPRPDQLLAVAAAVERESEHPLAAAVARRADEARVPKLVTTAFRNVPGRGA